MGKPELCLLINEPRWSCLQDRAWHSWISLYLTTQEHEVHPHLTACPVTPCPKLVNIFGLSYIKQRCSGRFTSFQELKIFDAFLRTNASSVWLLQCIKPNISLHTGFPLNLWGPVGLRLKSIKNVVIYIWDFKNMYNSFIVLSSKHQKTIYQVFTTGC